MARKKDPVKQIEKKYDDLIKQAKKFYNLGLKGTPKKDRTPFEKTQDYKILNNRKSNARYRVKNRDRDLQRKVEYRKKIKEQVQKARPKIQVLLEGPVFEVLSYASGGLLFDHANIFYDPSKQKYIGAIRFLDAFYTYTTPNGFFARIRQIFVYARTKNSGIMARVSEMSNDPKTFAQFVEIFASEGDIS